MEDAVDADWVQQDIERWLKEVEGLIVEHHAEQLGHWTKMQKIELDCAAESDSIVFAQQEAASLDCIQSILGDVEGQRDERNEYREAASEFREENDQEFEQELLAAGSAHAERTSEMVQFYSAKMRAIGEAWDANAWDRLDRALDNISWQKARQVHAANPTAGIADVYLRGELQDYLVAEREGWARSQKNDLERLQQEITQESDHIFKSLQAKLQKMAPEAVLVKPWANQLTQMASNESQRLIALEQEVCGAYESEIDAAMWQCEEDYRGYEAELQRILYRTVEERFRSAQQMRDMKLALCRWRLEFQKTYQFNVMTIGREESTRRSTNTMYDTVRETGPRRFLMVRKLLRRLWHGGRVPSKEMHSFLARICDFTARNDKEVGDHMTTLYENEIRKYGGMALIDHARNKQQLNLFMKATIPLKHKKEEAQKEQETDSSQQRR
mmetsp:Transcript_24758/g.43326  ORF Transcript_24758/g.43326 Transcript_24758/m.43326 type:complete len:442 (-) Transcript_24758:120-1445(-)